MRSTSTSIYSEAIRSLASLRNLRKIKLFHRVSAVTVVTYYKDTTNTHEFIGTAYTFDLIHLTALKVAVAHNNKTNGPPHRTEGEDDEDNTSEEDIEIEPTLLPAIGCSTLIPA